MRLMGILIEPAIVEYMSNGKRYEKYFGNQKRVHNCGLVIH